jgi:hypothetical protein
VEATWRSARALSADGLAPTRTIRSALFHGSQFDSALPACSGQVVVVILGTPGLRLKPGAAQAETRRELVELIDTVSLQMATSAPPPPIAHLERVVDIHRHFDV